jgi:hypothetical protein
LECFCSENGTPKLSIITAIAPDLRTLDFGEPINNGILKGNRLDLSAEGKSCLYHAELPNGITDIALLNIQSNIKPQRGRIFYNPNRTWNSNTTYAGE